MVAGSRQKVRHATYCDRSGRHLPEPPESAAGTLMSERPISTTVFDSILFRDAFGTPRMREIFCDCALIGRYIEVEIALARAEARCGVIPAEAAASSAGSALLAMIQIGVSAMSETCAKSFTTS